MGLLFSPHEHCQGYFAGVEQNSCIASIILLSNPVAALLHATHRYDILAAGDSTDGTPSRMTRSSMLPSTRIVLTQSL